MITFNQDVDYNSKTLQDKFKELSTERFSSYGPESHLWVSAIFKTIQGEAPFAGAPAIFLRLSGCNRGAKTDACFFCFPTNKWITTLNRGQIKMGDLKKGDRLMTLDDDKNVVETTVTVSHRRDVEQKDLMQLRIKKNGKIERHLVVVTKEHPFNIKGKGWVKAKDLKAGMKIIHASKEDALSFQRGINNAMFNADSRKRMMLNKVYAKSRLEERAQEILGSIVPKLKYVGDNSIAIGNEEDGFYCPDFIVKGSKKVIEVYDPTFKNYAEPRKTLKERRLYESKRRNHFNRHGYDVEFFTPEELDIYEHHGSGKEMEFSPEKYIKLNKKVREFVTNGIEIVEVMPISNQSYVMQRQRSPGKTPGTMSVANVTCAPYNHFVIDGMHVHNCDTQFSPEKGMSWGVEELVVHLQTITHDMANPLLVITGGEPLLQAPALKNFIELLCELDVFPMIQFETNGDMFKTLPAKALFETIEEINESFFDDDEELPEVQPINFVISPKRTIKEPAGGAFMEKAEDPGFFVRLLISGDPNSIYYTIPQFMIDNWPSDCFWLSPMTEYKRQPADDEIVKIEEDIDIEATRRNITRAIELANMFGYRVSLQAHSYIGIP